MKKLIAIIFIAALLTAAGQVSTQTTDSRPGKDTLNAVYVVDTFLVSGRVLVAKDGTGFIPFRDITPEQLNYVFELLKYFETGNKLKQWLKGK